MRIAVCDDDSVFLSNIVPMMQACKTEGTSLSVNPFCDGDSLVSAHEAEPFDAIFLDIFMPVADGIEVAREIRAADRSVRIVLLSSSNEFGPESYSIDASNYLLKPVDPAELRRCLEKLAKELSAPAQRIVVKAAYSVHSVDPAQIEYLEARRRHTGVFLSDGELIESTESLGALKERLSACDFFYHSHRSYLVNLKQVKSFTPEGATMRSGQRVPISRACRAGFKDAFFDAVFADVE